MGHLQVGDRYKMQLQWIQYIITGQVCCNLRMVLLAVKVVLLALNSTDPAIDIIIDFLVHMKTNEYNLYLLCVEVLQQVDHLEHDITPFEESRTLIFSPRRNIRLDDWDDSLCLNYTSFLKHDLLRIYHCFGLEHVAGADGYIRIATGCTNSVGGYCCYRIHSEELFLFFMTRCKKGSSITDLCNDVFGGHYNRWSFGFPWILRYLDRRYKNILGHQGLLRFRAQFPQFHHAIEQFMRKPKLHTDENGDTWRSPGLAECPYRIFGFVDCSIYKTDVPFSGPDGDKEGAPRKPRHGITQRAIYTGWKHVHGVKVETVMLPNGISTLFGPASCRRGDVGGNASLQQMSGLNNFLSLIHRGRPNLTPPYAALGDGVYRTNLECIRTYYRGYFNGAALTPYMRVCDAEMSGCRQSIEWGYGKTSNMFSICKDPDNFKLAESNPVSYV